MTFEMGRNAPARSQYYSEFLENCILACATRMSTSAGIRALGPRYAEQASSLVIQELQRPNVATLQGFLLLSDFEATRGRDRLGYSSSIEYTPNLGYDMISVSDRYGLYAN